MSLPLCLHWNKNEIHALSAEANRFKGWISRLLYRKGYVLSSLFG